VKGKALVLVAVLLGVVVVFLINQQFSALEAKANKPKTLLFQAVSDIEPGLTLRSALQDTGRFFRQVEADEEFARAYRDALDKNAINWQLDRVIVRQVPAGEFLRAQHLEPIEGAEMQAMIPDGMVATTFPVSQETSVGFLVAPGDVVDVYMLYTEEDPATPGGIRAVSKKVVEDILVFAVDDVLMDESGARVRPRGNVYRSVTVAGPEDQVRAVMEATMLGTLRLALKAHRGTGE